MQRLTWALYLFGKENNEPPTEVAIPYGLNLEIAGKMKGKGREDVGNRKRIKKRPS